MPVDKTDHRVRQMFGEIAPKYDRMNHLLSLQTDRFWRWRTVRLVRPAGDDPILDVCTGTGDLAFAFYRATGGKVHIVGSDFCPEMLAVGEAKKKRAGINGQLTFVEASTLALPFPDNEFQIVSVAFGLRNISDTNAGLREMTRVCRPGGKVAILEFTLPRWQPWKAIYGWYFRRVLPRLGHLLARNRASAYSYLPESVGEFPQYEGMAERMRAAGLHSVKFHPFTFGVATLYIGVK